LTRALVVGAACALVGCFDFEKALSNCHSQGRCADGGTTAGGGGGGGTASGGGVGNNGGGTSGGGGSATPASGPGFCADAGICWELPVPTGQSWRSVYVAAPGDVWGVGELGLLVHFDGGTLQPVDALGLTGYSPALANGFQSVWGTGPNDIWVTGDGYPLLHYDGGAWGPVAVGMNPEGAPQHCYGIDVDPRTGQVWVSCNGTIYHGSPAPTTDLNATTVYCSVLLVDDAGVTCGTGTQLLHADVTGSLKDVTPPGVNTPVMLAGHRLANGELWTGGSYFSGMTWLPLLARRTGTTTWQTLNPPVGCGGQVVGLAEDADGGLVVACDNGLVAPLNGTALRGAGIHEPSLTAISSASGYMVLAGQHGQLTTRSQGMWKNVITGDDRAFVAAAAYEGVVYAGGMSNLLMQRDPAGGWTFTSGRAGPGSGEVAGIAVTDAGMWIAQFTSAASTDIERRDGGGWQLDKTLPGWLNGLVAVGADLWTATSAGFILHRTADGQWSSEVDAGAPVFRQALWGTAPDHLFASGDPGFVLSRTAAGVWTTEMVALAGQLIAIAGDSDGAVWGIDSSGTVYTHAPGMWSVLPLGGVGCGETAQSLAVYQGDVWISGNDPLADAFLCVVPHGTQTVTSYTLPSPFGSPLLIEGDTLYVFTAAGVLHRSLP
jgi:hypothetical protein